MRKLQRGPHMMASCHLLLAVATMVRASQKRTSEWLQRNTCVGRQHCRRARRAPPPALRRTTTKPRKEVNI